MRKGNTMKALTKILKIREVQKELAQIDAFSANLEETYRLEERDDARNQLNMVQGLWEKYLSQKNIIPELIEGLSRDVIISDDALIDKNKRYLFARNKSKIKIDLWKLSDVKVRQALKLRKKVKRGIAKRKEEENLQRTEERTSYNWGVYD